MGDIFPKNFFQNFFVNTSSTGLSPYFDYNTREEGRGDTSPPLREGVYEGGGGI